MIVTTLQDKSFARPDGSDRCGTAEEARLAVDKQQAGAAIIIPADFSEQFSSLTGHATIEMYKDPTLTLGPGIGGIHTGAVQWTACRAPGSLFEVSTKQTGSSDPQAIGQTSPNRLHGCFAQR